MDNNDMRKTVAKTKELLKKLEGRIEAKEKEVREMKAQYVMLVMMAEYVENVIILNELSERFDQ